MDQAYPLFRPPPKTTQIRAHVSLKPGVFPPFYKRLLVTFHCPNFSFCRISSVNRYSSCGPQGHRRCNNRQKKPPPTPPHPLVFFFFFGSRPFLFFFCDSFFIPYCFIGPQSNRVAFSMIVVWSLWLLIVVDNLYEPLTDTSGSFPPSAISLLPAVVSSVVSPALYVVFFV